MTTPYTYDCSQHGEFVVFTPMAETTRHRDCPECGTESPKIIKVAFTFAYGRDQFHGPTLGERQRKQVADAAADGVQAEPVGARWI